MLLLWYFSLFVSIVTLIAGIAKKSWVFLLISSITFSPISYYFSGANNAWKYIGLVPIMLFVLAIVTWFSSKNKRTQSPH
jgi:lipid-A-disaccharide synthase-like uncharacterized protein